ncbi:NAD-dependent succinate-semialdehyde dehydrogenase [Leucobacter sp. UT-8R-CII-1-4]|uniref:NAD-dependent succinate-semialdehyde dehydrogenase n=1 Tax=Leucobacter sp. UT-8R-CII-1-4 TaxID=3040075 RepID=UPI0024A7BA07|nr:NAD-dependent succinate-semialdehyde dehydrogenase [Leucobacter sp. UT-8R-CII-1-4]MDI6024019.1 NAD-dependent succinate-semialdehyde dehydrogenase [Leucobacter sp. UT-8R-CII-1-4]
MSQYQVVDPSTGETVATYPTATDVEVTAAITAAGNAYDGTNAAQRAERAAMIARVAELHLERADELAEIIAQEMGKPVEQSRGEVEFSASIYQYYADEAVKHLADEEIPNEGGGRAFVRRVGLGVILGIMPWNFPYYQVARFAAPNLILGNTILLKHAEQCPRSAEAIEQIYKDAGFGESYVNLRAAHSQIERVIADPRVQGVSLTGSERAGAAVAEIAGRHLKKVVLELGGSDVFMVVDPANLDAAVEMAVSGRIENSGQACNGSKRIVILDRFYDEFAEKFVQAMGAVTSGPASDTGKDIGPLSSLRAAELLSSQVSRAVEQGAKLHIGSTEADGAFFPPTVLSDVTADMDVYTQELFGPAAVLYRVADEDEAVELANSSPYGLGSIVICQDTDRAVAIGDRLQVGMVFINGVGLDAPHLPFGGVKRSGFGRELGRYALEEFANKKLYVFAE